MLVPLECLTVANGVKDIVLTREYEFSDFDISGSPSSYPWAFKAFNASLLDQHVRFTRTYLGIAAVRENKPGVETQATNNSPARASSVCASSEFDLAPRFILSLVNSLCSLVRCRSTACLMGPSPACIPRASSRSWTRTRARFRELIFRSCLSNWAASMTSLNTCLSTAPASRFYVQPNSLKPKA